MMKRNEFLSTFTSGLSVACLACLASACSKDEMGAPAAPSNPNSSTGFTINLDMEIKSINDFVAKSGFIVIRTASGNAASSFVAFSSVCPHAGATVEYLSNTASFLCAAHGSTFSASGALTQGPATRGLTKVAIELSGAILRVKV